jgi:hypothetical protein
VPYLASSGVQTTWQLQGKAFPSVPGCWYVGDYGHHDMVNLLGVPGDINLHLSVCCALRLRTDLVEMSHRITAP